MDTNQKSTVCDTLQTLGDFVRYGLSICEEAQLCYAQGLADARDEVMYLVLSTLNLNAVAYYPELLSARLLPEEKAKLYDVLSQRVNQRIPAAYITQHMTFCGLDFYVDERVLIPRSPIAELIEQRFQPWLKPDAVANILELCTGSGCIAIACAHYFPEAHIDATDISLDALTVAKINAAKHQTETQITWHHADVFEGVPSKRYDLIVSNPPYVTREEMDNLPVEFRHEPQLGLQAGDDGLDIVRTIITSAKRYLQPSGILIIEVGNSDINMQAAFPDLELTWLEFEYGGHGVFLIQAADLPNSIR